MHLTALTIKTNISGHPAEASVSDKIYHGLSNTSLQEILVFVNFPLIEIFAVSTEPTDVRNEVLQLLGEEEKKENIRSLAENGFEYFLRFLISRLEDPGTSHNILVFLKEHFNHAMEAGAAGPILTRVYRQGLEYMQDILNHPDIANHSITLAEAIFDIAKRISEDMSPFQLLLIGDDPGEFHEIVPFFRRESAGKIIIFSENIANVLESALDLGCTTVDRAGLSGVLDTSTLIINTSRKTMNIFDTILPEIRNNRSNLYLYFQFGANEVEKSLSHVPNLFIQTREQVNRIIELHLDKRKQFLQSADINIKKEVSKFFKWMHSEERYNFCGIVSRSRHMHLVFETIRRIADSDINVLICGDTGTGKELVARAVHQNSNRKKGQFIAVNCSAIPETLLEGELFGYEKGAFTGAVSMKRGLVELASGGTLFLDEIGDIPPQIQVKLLRVLQEREVMRLGNPSPIKVNVRLLAATNRSMEILIGENRFRSDLYYRINTLQINLPPLAEKREDILLLTRFFIQKLNKRLSKNIHALSDEVKEALQIYDWPGNVRELENVIERAIAVSVGGRLTLTDLPHHFSRTKQEIQLPRQGPTSLKELESSHIRELLEKENRNYTTVAVILGISRTTLWRKMKKYGISR